MLVVTIFKDVLPSLPYSLPFPSHTYGRVHTWPDEPGSLRHGPVPTKPGLGARCSLQNHRTAPRPRKGLGAQRGWMASKRSSLCWLRAQSATCQGSGQGSSRPFQGDPGPVSLATRS